MGYSFGGCVAMRLAIQHPERVRRLVVVSAPFADDGWYADMRVQQKQVGAAMAPMMAETPMYKTYKAVAPKPDDFPRLLDAMGEYMRAEVRLVRRRGQAEDARDAGVSATPT